MHENASAAHAHARVQAPTSPRAGVRTKGAGTERGQHSRPHPHPHPFSRRNPTHHAPNVAAPHPRPHSRHAVSWIPRGPRMRAHARARSSPHAPRRAGTCSAHAQVGKGGRTEARGNSCAHTHAAHPSPSPPPRAGGDFALCVRAVALPGSAICGMAARGGPGPKSTAGTRSDVVIVTLSLIWNSIIFLLLLFLLLLKGTFVLLPLLLILLRFVLVQQHKH